MATHSSFLAWRIPGTGEPGGLPSMGSDRVGHDRSDLAAAAAAAGLVARGSVGREEMRLSQKSCQSWEKVNSCPETNSKDSAQPGQFLKGKMGKRISELSRQEVGFCIISTECRLTDSLSPDITLPP